MNKTACRVCGKKEVNKKLIAKDYFLGTKKEYEYEICSNCRSLFLVEIPDYLPLLYKNYYSFQPPSGVSFARRLMYLIVLKNRGILAKLISLFLNRQEDFPIKSLGPLNLHFNDKILDVGCGAGSLLQLLNKLGFKKCIGIDPFLDSDRKISTEVMLKKIEFLELREKFDLIMFHHVFEHFSTVRDVLKHVHSLLSEKGVCIIRMPDVDSFSFARYKENWFSIHAPFHLTLPSREGMQTLVKDCGLVIEKIVGEQLMEFFFYSVGHGLGVTDYERYGNRRFFEKYGNKKVPPFHIKNEMKDAKQRLKQVKKYDLCDWSVYYLRKDV